MRPTGIIDTPSAFDPPQDWLSFIADLAAIPEPRPDDVEAALSDAREHLATLDDSEWMRPPAI
jgi:hypothetical protein